MILVYGPEKYTKPICNRLKHKAKMFSPNIDSLKEFKKNPSLCTVAAQEEGFAIDASKYHDARMMICVLPRIARYHLVSSGHSISYKVLTEYAPVEELVNRLHLRLVIVGEGFPGLHSWEVWPRLVNTGIVYSVVVSDYSARYDEQWSRILDGVDIEVYGNGWECFSGWDKKRFLGPVSRDEGCRLLSRAKRTPIVNWNSEEPYRAIAAGCLPCNHLRKLPLGFAETLRRAKRDLQPDWRYFDDRIKMD